jgi:hypothetical protein
MGLKDLVDNLDNAKEVAESTNHKISIAEQAIGDYLLQTDQFYKMLIKFRDEVRYINYSGGYDSTSHLSTVRDDMVKILDAKIERYILDKLNIERGIQPLSGKIMVMGEVISPIEFVNGSFQTKVIDL